MAWGLDEYGLLVETESLINEDGWFVPLYTYLSTLIFVGGPSWESCYLKVKVGNTFINPVNIYVKVNDEWVSVKDMLYLRFSGVWRKVSIGNE